MNKGRVWETCNERKKEQGDNFKFDTCPLYSLAIVRYRIPIEEVDESYREAHRDYLRDAQTRAVRTVGLGRQNS